MSRRFDILKGHRAVEFDYHSEGKYVNYSECEKLNSRIATLEALIADAPHSISCKEGMRAWDSPTDFEVCSCWKSRALDIGAKG